MAIIDVHTHAYTRKHLELLRAKGGVCSLKQALICSAASIRAMRSSCASG
jgi:hypothetical protein